MNKQEYLDQLRAVLGCLPEEEIEESAAFYAEMIDDRVADGMSEEEAVAQLDDPKAAARAIIGDLPAEGQRTISSEDREATPLRGQLPAQARGARLGSKPMNRALYWSLVILGSPLWLTLLLAAAAVAIAIVAIAAALVLSIVAVVASLLLTLWVLAAGLMAGGPLGIAVCFYGLAMGQPAYAAAELGSGLICFGLGLFCLHGAAVATKGADRLWRISVDKAKVWFAKGRDKMKKHRSGVESSMAFSSPVSTAGAKEVAHEA